MKLKKNDIIQVTWTDAYTIDMSGGVEYPETYELPVHYRLGYFINQDKNCIRMGSDLRENSGFFTEIHLIPNGMVKKIELLKEAKK